MEIEHHVRYSLNSLYPLNNPYSSPLYNPLCGDVLGGTFRFALPNSQVASPRLSCQLHPSRERLHPPRVLILRHEVQAQRARFRIDDLKGF